VARFDRTIPPGGEGKITLEMRTKGYQGEMHKSARVVSNDPKRPQITITMKGKIWVPIDVKPRYVRLRGTVDEEVETIVNLLADKKDPLIMNLASVSIPEKVDATLEETEKGRAYQLKVKNKVKGEAKYAGTLKLTTNYPEKPEVVIRIAGDIRGLVEVRPKALNFGRVSQKRFAQIKNQPRGMTRSISVILNKGTDLKIEKTELEKSLFKVSVKPVQSGRVAQILVEPDYDKLKKGANQDRLKIYTNQEAGKTLEVAIRLDVL
jgi:hypothetical protein